LLLLLFDALQVTDTLIFYSSFFLFFFFVCLHFFFFFFFHDPATTEIYTLSYTTLFRSQLAYAAPFALAVLVDIFQSTFHQYAVRSEEHTSELQSRFDLVCRLLLEKKKKKNLIL